jgi:hypothetical protein
MTENNLNVLNGWNDLNQGPRLVSFKQFNSFKSFKTL